MGKGCVGTEGVVGADYGLLVMLQVWTWLEIDVLDELWR